MLCVQKSLGFWPIWFEAHFEALTDFLKNLKQVHEIFDFVMEKTEQICHDLVLVYCCVRNPYRDYPFIR